MTDVVEAIVNSAPTFNDGDITTRVVPENTLAGVNIGSPVNATDTLGDILTYTLGGMDADSFEIDSSTGQLKTNIALDYETKYIYSVTITADDGELSETITVIISVIDVNDTVLSVDFLPVADRTPQVRDAIVAAVPNVSDAADITESQVGAITNLNLRSQDIRSLKTGDFSGMTSLSNLNLHGNHLSKLPHGIFTGLTSLSALRLGGNTLEPTPIIVTLQQVSGSEYRAVVKNGAPFNVVLPINVINGSLSDGITSVTIPQGSIASATFTVIGPSAEVSFGSLPSLPANHFGYTLAQSATCNRTTIVADAIANAVGVSDCSDVTEVELATITWLDLSNQSITSLKSGDFDGMLSLRTLNLDNNELINLPEDIFDDLGSLKYLSLNDNKLTDLPNGIFSNLIALTGLDIFNNDLSSLPNEVFDGLSSITSISLNDNELVSLSNNLFDGLITLSSLFLSNNKLTNLPVGIFDGLTNLVELHLNGNPVHPIWLVVSLEKVGTNQFKAIIPTGAPFDVILPITVVNGTLADSTNTLTIPIGTVESQSLTVTRTPDTTDAVTATIGTFPSIPTNHSGYAFIIGMDLPIEVISQVNLPPEFAEGNSASRSIAENTVKNTNIGATVSATDSNTDDTLTYTLDGTDAVSFDIDSATGQLKTKVGLDYETKNSYSITLTVSDGELTDTIDVTISVSDVNEAPTFTVGDSTTLEVAENTDTDENIGSAITATDVDEDTLTYSLGGTDAVAFSIDTDTGQLRTKALLDFETKSSYSVTITVTDGTETATIDVTISISDVFENSAPEFTAGTSTTLSISENTGSGADIGSAVVATDVDDDTLTYTLDGTDASSFSIDSLSGQLKTKSPLDYETRTSYKVTVIADDSNGGTASITVTIDISDVDETSSNTPPVFTDGTSTSRSVLENSSIGTDIGSVVGATDDDDGDTLIYSLGGTDASSFSIDSTTGQLRTNAALDFETKASYSVIVTVSDENESNSITVTINITDIYETPLNIAPVFNDGSSTSRSVLENSSIGTDIGSAVSASDDGDTLTYTLGGTDASSFSIDSSTGQLNTNTSLNYESEDSYSVTITASDGNLTSSIAVTIDILDANDAPVFTVGSSTSRIVAEDSVIGTNIGTTVSATDEDGDNLSYSLSGTDASLFRIDNLTGQVQVGVDLSIETKPAYSLIVTASDGTLSDSIAVSIIVRSSNDAPVFTEGNSATRTIVENSATNVNIGSVVSATDADADNIVYTLGGTDADSFGINTNSGQLITKDELNFEDKSSYSVTITASDGNLTDTITITINVTDANDAPVFTAGTSTSRSIEENTGADTDIGSVVSATDEDEDSLTYSLAGTDASSFAIVSTSGQLQTSASLDYETKTSYSVTVSVSDGKDGNDSISVTINVTDVNENRAPSFTEGDSTTRSVLENTTSGQNIGTAVVATDSNTGDTLTYTLGGTDASSFSIVSTSGQLQTNSALDYETKSSYSVTISVSDGKSGTDSINVTINVTDVTETPITPVNERTRAVRNAIVSAVSGVNSADNVTAAHLASISILNLKRKSITELKSDDFDGLTSLETLFLDFNSISDISPLANLTSLRTLNLGANSISDISSVANLTNLKALLMMGNSISDISPVANLTKLKKLDIGTNSVSDISALANLTSLQELFLNSNSISDISPLANLTSLTNLLIYGNSISDISALANLTSLTLARLDTNSIRDVSALESLTSLSMVFLAGNPISDYGPLHRMKSVNPEFGIDININNNPPVFSDGDSTTRSVAENTASEQNIGTAVAATDSDAGDTLTYTLGGTDADSFDIDSSTGQLQTSAPLDYETKSSYSVTIDVSDGNDGLDRISVTINVTDVAGAASLEVELQSVPESTTLLSNYPNPFNPETWIPYQLSKPSEVTITIYDIRGRVVRRLNLGHQVAGFYQGRNQAAHWDGRNAVGEKVATGVYFYTLKASEFSYTRKMLIQK
ncbi:cadherin domain-containing protein [Candidatus Poribacteria bacterium]|nr:cadherin domain-containing protein [Candidatus Poribacteria bacterium]